MKLRPKTSIPQAHNHWLDNAKNIMYPTSNLTQVNADIQQVPTIQTYQRHDTHNPETIASEDNSVVFRTIKYLPKNFKIGNVINSFYSPQSINVTNGGWYAYIGYNSSASNNNKYGAKQVQFLKIHLHNPSTIVSESGETDWGTTFTGGHGQAVTKNPSDQSIWNMCSHEGNTQVGYMQRINGKTMVPYYQIPFHLGKYNTSLGDDLVFDNHNHVYNFVIPTGSSYITIYKGRLRYDLGFHLDEIKQQIPAPCQIIQVVAYNPHDGKMYIGSDNQITSFPANKIGKLKSSDFTQYTFDSNSETEGLSFDKAGNAYLLMSRSPRILKSESFR